MKSLVPPRRRWCCLAFLAAPPLLALAAGGEEPAQRFLEGLRQRGYYDTAIAYLDHMATSRLAPEEFRQSLLYEKSVTLIERAGLETDLAARERRLDQAQQALRLFMDQQADHPLAGAATSQLGNLLVERARLKIEQSRAASQPELLADARGLYDEAISLFAKSQQELRGQLEGMPKLIPLYDLELQQRQKRLRAEYVQSQLLAAAVLEDKAETAAAESAERKQLLAQAAAKYGEIYAKYRDWQAGLLARMYQGRCQEKAGNPSDALACYDSILTAEGNDEDVRRLKTKTLNLAMECLVSDAQQKYAEAIQRGAAWLANALPHEAVDPDWVRLRLAVAEAHQRYAEQIRRETPRDRRIGTSLEEAKKLAASVAAQPGPYQQEGRRLVAQLGGRPERVETPSPPATFGEAKDAGRQTLDTFQTARIVLEMVPQRLADETDEGERQRLRQQLADAEKSVAENRGKARELFELAQRLADDRTPAEELNDVRYYLAFLHFSEDDFYDAAVLGEFVARRWPADPRARACAKIAHASFVRLYGEARNADTSFASRRLQSLAAFIVEQWPDSPEAQEALNTLIPLVVASGQADKAEQYLAKIPADSPARANAELQTGKALWGAYLRGAQEVRQWEQDGPPPQADVAAQKAFLQNLKLRAEKTLTTGIERMRKSGQVSSAIAEAVLALAQIYVDTQQSAQAILLLEDPRIGALTLVEQEHPAAAAKGFAEETYKTALRAYISSLGAASRGGVEVIDKARSIMGALRREASQSAEGEQKLIATYYSLAMDLKRQLELVESAASREALSKGFETFLEQVGQGANDLNVIYWVAETFAGMADQYPKVSGNLSPAAKRFYLKAHDTYARILAKGEESEGWLPAGLKTQVRMRLAVMKRELGDFKAALDMLEQILRENSALLNVQIEAARTYQQWGDGSLDGLYLRAIGGGRLLEGKPIIWGWGAIAVRTAGREPFRNAFHEARFNLALCRYKYAMRQQDEAARKEQLTAAKQDIRITYLLYKDLGGSDWEPKYDVLLKAIQRNLGEPATGLEVLQREANDARAA